MAVEGGAASTVTGDLCISPQCKRRWKVSRHKSKNSCMYKQRFLQWCITVQQLEGANFNTRPQLWLYPEVTRAELQLSEAFLLKCIPSSKEKSSFHSISTNSTSKKSFAFGGILLAQVKETEQNNTVSWLMELRNGLAPVLLLSDRFTFHWPVLTSQL